MAAYPHSSNFKNLVEATIGFAQFARQEGLNVGLQETQDALLAAKYGTIEDKQSLKYALKSIFCTNPEEGALFDTLFDQFWDRKKMAIHSRQVNKNRSNIQKKGENSAVWMGFGKEGDEEKEDSKNISGANKTERLRKTDFSKISAIDSKLLEELALQLWKQMSLRLKRKMKTSKIKRKSRFEAYDSQQYFTWRRYDRVETKTENSTKTAIGYFTRCEWIDGSLQFLFVEIYLGIASTF